MASVVGMAYSSGSWRWVTKHRNEDQLPDCTSGELVIRNIASEKVFGVGAGRSGGSTRRTEALVPGPNAGENDPYSATVH
jgi:hypothetical protein